MNATHAAPASSETSAAIRFFGWRNLLTYGSIAAALGAMAVAEGPNGRAHAGALLGAAAVLDMLDGRFARLFRSTPLEKRFGAELDSLADGVAFGVAPVVCLHRLGAAGEGLPAIAFAIVSLAYVLAALTRLGAFNVSPGAERFVGLPTTLAGLAWSALLLFPSGSWTIAVLGLLAAAMVAPIPIARPRPQVLGALLACTIMLIGLHIHWGSR